MEKHKINQDEIIQMEQELIRMEMELNDFYCEAGKTILEKAEQHEQKINNLVESIIETRRKLLNAKDEKFCPECGDHNDQVSNYCNRCGFKFKTKLKTRSVQYESEPK